MVSTARLQSSSLRTIRSLLDAGSNAPFFNIWSACELFERRSSTLPVLKDWKANCTSAHVAFRNDVGGNLLGDIQVPKWAQTKTLADDTLFDVAGIVIGASALT